MSSIERAYSQVFSKFGVFFLFKFVIIDLSDIGCLFFISVSGSCEESIDVNNILKETPFGVGVLIGAKVFIDSSVDLLSHLDSLLGGELNGLSFLGTGDGDEGKSCVFEHHC